MTPVRKLPVARPWYDFLETLIPYRDLVMLFGGSLVVAGAALIYVPAAFIIAGAGVLKLSFSMTGRFIPTPASNKPPSDPQLR